MSSIESILFPVDFSPSCIAMASYVTRAATIFGASVTMLHVADIASANGFELFLRSPNDVVQDHVEAGREALANFLLAEFPPGETQRLVTSGEAAAEIARVAREGDYGLIIMPTHSGRFRQMLLGSTTAKVLNDADCPVLTSRHAETIKPHPLDHRKWLCAVGLSRDSERVLRFAHQALRGSGGKLSLVHAVQTEDSGGPIQLDLEEQLHAEETQRARARIDTLQRVVGLEVPVHIVLGRVKDALLEVARNSEADALLIGRSPGPGSYGRMRDLTYAMVRDSPFPVLSV